MFPLSSRNIFDPPSYFERIFSSPLHFLIKTLYDLFSKLHSAPRVPPHSRIRVVCISDTHTHTFPIPEGDLLIHAGDFTNRGTVTEIQAQIDWLATLPHTHKVAIAGNHDTYLDPRSRVTLTKAEQAEELDWKDITYLQHSGAKFGFDNGRELSVYGAPQIPRCGGKDFAFQYDRHLDAWTDTLPSRVDILITHTPPRYHMDLSSPWLGCRFLLKEMWKLKPALHVCGHIHAGAGREILRWDDMQHVYETSLARDESTGFIRQVLNPTLWVDAVKVIWHGVTTILWHRVWGGEARATIMVNAALMVNNTGKLGNTVQVVEL